VSGLCGVALPGRPGSLSGVPGGLCGLGDHPGVVLGPQQPGTNSVSYVRIWRHQPPGPRTSWPSPAPGGWSGAHVPDQPQHQLTVSDPIPVEQGLHLRRPQSRLTHLDLADLRHAASRIAPFPRSPKPGWCPLPDCVHRCAEPAGSSPSPGAAPVKDEHASGDKNDSRKRRYPSSMRRAPSCAASNSWASSSGSWGSACARGMSAASASIAAPSSTGA
jgi:hypothetical protein